MSKRLQVVVSEEELEAFRQSARKERLTLSEWVRKALTKAQRVQRGPTPGEKLEALDRALECQHPTADIGDMLASIERGRGLR